MQRKPLPLPPKSNQQVKEYTGAVKRGLNGYYISPSDKGWSVRRANASAVSSSFSTKAAAISYAKNSVGNQADIVVYGKDGSVTLVGIKSIPQK
jgi:hypothetical protein